MAPAFLELKRRSAPALVAEMIARAPDLLITSGPQLSLAVKSATATVPIVFVVVYDPVGIGLVASLARPGGNVTGLATYAAGDFIAKRIEIFRELIPNASIIAILVNPRNPMQMRILAEEIPHTSRQVSDAARLSLGPRTPRRNK